jgi:hypothetical protein
MIGLLGLVPVALTGVGALMMAWNTVTKLRTRVDLSKAIRANPQDLNEVRTQLNAQNVDAAAAVVRKYVPSLSKAERGEAAAALAQPSETGRTSYIRAVAGQAEPAPNDAQN